MRADPAGRPYRPEALGSRLEAGAPIGFSPPKIDRRARWCRTHRRPSPCGCGNSNA